MKCLTMTVFSALLFASLPLAGLADARAAAAAPSTPAKKAKVAVFPIGGAAGEDLRDKVAFALRKKLDRDGAYDVIDGPAMQDAAAAGDAPVVLATTPDAVRKLAAGLEADVLVWGDLDGGSTLAGSTLRLKVLDLREKNPTPRVVSKPIADPTDLRFVTEEILAALPGVKGFDHPNEEAVRDDEISRQLWAKNPNLLGNGDFSDGGGWDGIYMAEKYRVTIGKALPPTDKICIYPLPAPAAPARSGVVDRPNLVLAMRMSKDAAENNGLACLSDPIRIKPGIRYRISFRYQSDGPSTHVFVKGYTTGPNLKGEPTDREVFRTQVSPTGATGGKWETVVCDINPYHPAFRVEKLRVDLYTYLSPGVILWDDVVVKEIGPLKDRPKDDALQLPVTQPAGLKK